jgi:hypothetical protein
VIRGGSVVVQGGLMVVDQRWPRGDSVVVR